MPFTPYHFGPGLFVKGLAARWFSWIAFVAVQVVIDCETLYYLERPEYPIRMYRDGSSRVRPCGNLVVL